MKKLLVALTLLFFLPTASALAMQCMAEEELESVQGSGGITITLNNGALGGAFGASFTSLSYTDNDGVAGWGHPWPARIQLSNIIMSNRWEWSPTTIDVTAVGANDGWICIDPPNLPDKDFQFTLQFLDPNNAANNRTAGIFRIENLDWLNTGGYTNDLELFTLGTAAETKLGIWIGGEWRADYLYWMDDGYTGRTGDAYLKTETFAFYNNLTTLYGWLDSGSDGTNSYLRFTWPNSAENNNRNVLLGRIGVVPTAGTALNNTNTLFSVNVYNMSLSQDNHFLVRAGGNSGEGVSMLLDAGFSAGNLVLEDHDGFTGYATDRYLAFNGFHMNTGGQSWLRMDAATISNTTPALVFYGNPLWLPDFGFNSVQMGTNSATGGGPSLFSLDCDNVDADLLFLISGYNGATDPMGIQLQVELGLRDADLHFGDSNGITAVSGPPGGGAVTGEGHFYISNIKINNPSSYSGRAIAYPVIMQMGTSGTSRIQLSMPNIPMTVEFTTRTANASNLGEDIFMHHIEGSVNFNGVPVEIYAH